VKDVQEMAERIQELVSQPDTRINLGQKGRQFVLNNIDMKMFNEFIRSVYKKCVIV
jgi:glycosyltransferase involved in cell wall biosynthesis